MHKRKKFNILIAGHTLLLLAVSLGILFYFSHKALKNEAMRDAELTLDGTMQNIDNILLSVEQSTGNIYLDLLEHLDDPDRMFTYSREVLESNPKYSDRQHIKLKVNDTDSTVRFTVEDIGSGMPADKEDHLFKPFTREGDLSEGLGLGLPLARRHAKSLGGKLIFDSNYQQGCRVTIELSK